MKLRKGLGLLMAVVMLLMSTLSVQAHSDKNNQSGKDNDTGVLSFSDVPSTHWAHDAIMLMANYKIINGYSDGTFRPDSPVSRAEFAKMMVLTLQKDLENPSKATFDDVQQGGWDYKYIETAKYYMTYYKTSSGNQFRPQEGAQREDLAVSILKGLGIDPSSDTSILNNIADASSISQSCKGYVAAAIANNIMIGDTNKMFNPKKIVTRAETAVLLARLIQDEKVIFDEQKVVYDNPTTPTTSKTPYLTAYVNSNKKVILDWTSTDAANFTYYKVVLSKADSTPSYPDNGYMAVISDVSTSGYEFEAGAGYNNGDLGGEVKPGTYYAAITAVYGDKKYTSNVVTITVPEKAVVSTTGRTPVLNATTTVDGGFMVTWSKTEAVSSFSYYKVVLSRFDESPSYPDNGYLTYITDINSNSYLVKAGQSYNGGDVGGTLVSGTKYYMTITAVYGDNKYTSNVLYVTLP